MNAAARPIYEEGIVLISNGSGGMVAVRPNGTGNVTDSHVAWKSMKGVPKKSSPIVLDRLVYMVSDDGIVSCRQLADGKIVWQKRVGGPYAASPIYADGKLYFFGIEGDILTIKSGRNYEMLAHTKLGDGFMASPAVVGDQLILRSKSALYSLSTR